MGDAKLEDVSRDIMVGILDVLVDCSISLLREQTSYCWTEFVITGSMIPDRIGVATWQLRLNDDHI